MKKPRNLKSLIYLLTIGGSLVAGVSSCSNGKNINSNASTDAVGGKLSQVYFDDLGVVPLDAGNAKFLARLNNTYDERFLLNSINVINPATGKVDTSLGRVTRGNCDQVPANNYCTVNYSSNLAKNGEFIIEAKLQNAITGQKITTRQFVRVGQVSNLNGLEFQASLDEIKTVNRHFSMALPVYLKSGFKELQAVDGVDGKLVCWTIPKKPDGR